MGTASYKTAWRRAPPFFFPTGYGMSMKKVSARNLAYVMPTSQKLLPKRAEYELTHNRGMMAWWIVVCTVPTIFYSFTVSFLYCCTSSCQAKQAEEASYKLLSLAACVGTRPSLGGESRHSVWLIRSTHRLEVCLLTS